MNTQHAISLTVRNVADSADACAASGIDLVEFNGEHDHVHLLVHYPPKVALSRLVGSLKGVSARRLRQEFPTHIRAYL